MDAAGFAAHVGPVLIHRTRAENRAAIAALGLMPAAQLAQRAGMAPEALVLRPERMRLQIGAHRALLTHQRPLLAGRGDFLDAHTPKSWALQLDRRLFFWPTRRGAAFGASLDGAVVTLPLDARRFFAAFAPDIDLSPINSGNATRRPARRGDWLYVPVSAGWDAFAENRRARGLVASRDRIGEVSIRRAIPPDLLRHLLTEDML
ncbi:MAG: hypothetical protein AAF748_15050 [Pseudomonadota bacterium]